MFRRLFRREPKEDKQPGDRRQAPQARPESRETGQIEAQKDFQMVRQAGEERGHLRKDVGDENENLARRERRAAESILENESLTADLDDKAAKELINWGIASAKAAAQQTAGLDDDQAEEEMSKNLRATRGLMRSVNKLVSKRADIGAEESAQLLDKIDEQVTAIYGQSPLPRDDKRLQALLNRLAEPAQDPAQIVVDLRGLFEKPGGTPPQNPGEDNG